MKDSIATFLIAFGIAFSLSMTIYVVVTKHYEDKATIIKLQSQRELFYQLWQFELQKKYNPTACNGKCVET